MRIHDLHGVEVEHLLGAASSKGLVKLRVLGDGHILLGEMEPAQARDIAAHLFESAARAEYEQDLYATAVAHGLDEPVIGALLGMVREGEQRRLGG